MKEAPKKRAITLNGKHFEVPPGGSLGLLALGNVGVRAWKQAKKDWDKQNSNVEEK